MSVGTSSLLTRCGARVAVFAFGESGIRSLCFLQRYTLPERALPFARPNP
jgi:hypothetical protein